jgi:hypothetical protein
MAKQVHFDELSPDGRRHAVFGLAVKGSVKE